MKFIIDERHGNETFYWLEIDAFMSFSDYDTAKLLCISLEEYHNELITFISNKDYYRKGDDIVFYNYEEAKAALEYLNDKYGVFLALLRGR